MLQTTDEKDLSFVITKIDDFGGPERVEYLMGIYDHFDDAEKALEGMVCDHVLKGSMDACSISDLFKNGFNETSFHLDAAEKNAPLENNKFSVSTVMFTDDGPNGFMYSRFGALASTYRRIQTQMDNLDENIENAFSKDKPDTRAIAALQQRKEEFKESKKFIDESIMPSFIEDVVKSQKVMEAQQTHDFINNIDSKLKERNSDKYEEVMNTIKANANGGTMEDAFRNAKKLGNH